MSNPGAWFRTMFLFLLLLIVCAVSASAQSSRGTLTFSIQLVPSTALLFGDDGKIRIIEANGAHGLTITTIDAPVTFDRPSNVGVMPTTTPQRSRQLRLRLPAHNRSKAGKELFTKVFRTTSDTRFDKQRSRPDREIKSSRSPDNSPVLNEQFRAGGFFLPTGMRKVMAA